MTRALPDHIVSDEPIMPALGLGGLAIGAPVTDLRVLLDQLPNRFVDLSWATYVPLWEVRFKLGVVEAGIDIRTGRIFKLIAVAGYEGSLFGNVKVGVTVANAQIYEPRFVLEERTGQLVVENQPGVVIEVSDDLDPIVDESMPITAISVFDPTLWRDYY